MNLDVDDLESPVESYRRAVGEAKDLGYSYPLLERALEDAAPTTRTTTTWVHHGLVDLKRGANLAEIKRFSWSFTRTARALRWFYDAAKNMKRDRLLELLESIEWTLMHGKAEKREVYCWVDYDGTRVLETYTITTCAGALEILGRPPINTDVFRLRPLTPIEFLPNRQPPDSDRYDSEWLCEFTLEAHPARPV
jgi:hypothetical protein